MIIDDFIKLPASEAGWLYRHHRDAGEAEEASRLHQAYFEAHRVKLSDDRQIAEAALTSRAATPEPPMRVDAGRGREQSKVRRVGILLSGLGLIIGLFAAAAGIGPAGLVIAGCLAGSGFALWLIGILEDRLIAIQVALRAT
jgi:hypothetical protein